YAPSYQFNTPTVFPMNQDPNAGGGLGFQDFPARTWASGNQSWTAELGLVCIKDTPGTDGFRDVRVINTFLWGFNFNGLPANPPPPGIGNVGSFPPAFWSPPTASYLNTLNNFYDGMGGGPP